jgi:hypothetical protein
MYFRAIKGFWTQEVPKHLKEEKIKINKGFYEGEGERCAP